MVLDTEAHEGEPIMYTSLHVDKVSPSVSTCSTEDDTSPILIELTKKVHFCRFLEKERNTAKTEAEKEAVQTILLKTRVEIRAMKREWKQLQGVRRSNRREPKKLASACTTQRIK